MIGRGRPHVLFMTLCEKVDHSLCSLFNRIMFQYLSVPCMEDEKTMCVFDCKRLEFKIAQTSQTCNTVFHLHVNLAGTKSFTPRSTPIALIVMQCQTRFTFAHLSHALFLWLYLQCCTCMMSYVRTCTISCLYER
jgi:hypothetical protein